MKGEREGGGVVSEGDIVEVAYIEQLSNLVYKPDHLSPSRKVWRVKDDLPKIDPGLPCMVQFVMAWYSRMFVLEQ